jgi:hypothetical protein
LNSVVKGWKLRRILTGCREIISIKIDLAEIEQALRKTKGPKDRMIPSLMSERRVKIEELCRVIPHLYRKGRWVFSLQKKLQASLGLSQ